MVRMKRSHLGFFILQRFTHFFKNLGMMVVISQRAEKIVFFFFHAECVSSYLTRVLVNQGSSPREGTAVSMSGWDLINCRVSSGNSMELLKDAAGLWPAQEPGLERRGAKGLRSVHNCTHQGVITILQWMGSARQEPIRSQKRPQLET